ncbi:flagellar basal body rod protein FlgF [Aurantivibrio plasticivorans]
MDRALYIGMTAAKHNMLAQDVHANNLANVNTQGFKADFAQARSMGVYYGDGFPSRAFSLTESPAIDFSQGTAISTERDLDISLENRGFIAVQQEDGSEAYTRNGRLFVDTAGIVRTGSGLPVLGDGGPITLPEFDQIELAVDGTISVVIRGESPDAMAAVNRIKLVDPDPQQLVKNDMGLLELKGGGEVDADVDVRILRGFLESSNVNPVGELTDILALSRQYEMSIKLMQTIDENSQASARLLQIT